jgi:large subunit ribosomal protein L18e
VNVSKINRYAGDGETILVPGKVLGSGALDQPVIVAALNFSRSAADKIQQAKGTCMTIEQLLQDNPKGSRVRILR